MKKPQYGLLVTLITLCVATICSAAPQSREIKQASQRLRAVQREQRKLAKAMTRLSAEDLQKFVQSNGSLPDSDADGIPDELEDGAHGQVCNPDSDSDGLEDGDEIAHGSDPSDRDSDHDGVEDGGDADVKGIISAIDAATIGVAGVVVTLSGSTQYLDVHGNPVIPAAFAIGDCIDVEGHRQSDSTYLAIKVKAEEDCSGTGH